MFDSTICSEFPIDKSYYLWVTYTSNDPQGQVWYITSNKQRTAYQLWKGKKKTKWESDNPLSLYEKIK